MNALGGYPESVTHNKLMALAEAGPKPQTPSALAPKSNSGGLMGAAKGLGNALMGGLNTAFQYAAPEAYQQGRQRAGQAAMGNALATGDYGQASMAAFQSGNLDAGMRLNQFQQKQQEAERERQKLAQQQRQDEQVRMLQTAMQLDEQLLQMPMEQRAAFVQQMAGQLPGMDVNAAMAPENLTDEAIRAQIAQGRVALTRFGQAPEQIEGKVVNDRLVNPYTGEVIGDYADEDSEMTAAYRTLDQRARAAGLEPGTAAYQRFMLNGGAESDGQVLQTGPDGEIYFGPASGAPGVTRYDQRSDTKQVEDARQRAQDLRPLLNTLYSARANLLGPDMQPGTEDDAQTGFYGPLQLGLQRLIPGETQEEVQLENLDALAKEYGIEKLSGIGGNDTERELLTAIQTGPNVSASGQSNLDRINRMISVFEFIGESRAQFISRWRQEHGSLASMAQSGPYQGMTFDEALAQYQREQAGERGLLGAAPSGSMAPGVTRQTNELEDLAAALEAAGKPDKAARMRELAAQRAGAQ